MFPAALKPLLRAARAAGVKAVRNPFGQLWPLPFRDIFWRRKLWLRFAETSVLRNFAARFRREVQEHGLKTPDGSIAVLVTGSLDRQLFTAMMDALPEGTWEFVCHPGYSDSDLDRVRTPGCASRANRSWTCLLPRTPRRFCSSETSSLLAFTSFKRGFRLGRGFTMCLAAALGLRHIAAPEFPTRLRHEPTFSA